jgi:hypothetical protein
MKISALSVVLALATVSGVQAFAPAATFVRPSSALQAKYKTMDEILAKFPEDMPILINFYDGNTEKDIKNDIFRAKTLLQDRCTLVSIKQQDYPELAKLWDCDTKSPSMILFKDGNPVTRLYEETHYLEIVAKFGQYCRPAGEEHKPVA